MLPLESTRSGHDALEKVHYTHDAMIDIVIAKPDVTQRTLAEYFGYSEPWISRIFCSDAFQARLAARRGEVIIPGLLATFEERLKLLATKSIELVMEKLEQKELDLITGEEKSTADIGTVFKALELSTKSLGYGARQTNVAIQNNLTVNTMSDQQLMEIAQGATI